MSVDNNFKRLIEDKMIIANNKLQIEKLMEYTVNDVMSQGEFTFVDAPYSTSQNDTNYVSSTSLSLNEKSITLKPSHRRMPSLPAIDKNIPRRNIEASQFPLAQQ